jgi:hypothetical protein
MPFSVSKAVCVCTAAGVLTLSVAAAALAHWPKHHTDADAVEPSKKRRRTAVPPPTATPRVPLDVPTQLGPCGPQAERFCIKWPRFDPQGRIWKTTGMEPRLIALLRADMKPGILRDTWKRDRGPVTSFMKTFFLLDDADERNKATSFARLAGRKPDTPPITPQGMYFRDATMGRGGLSGQELLELMKTTQLTYLNDRHRADMQEVVDATRRDGRNELGDLHDSLCAVSGDVYIVVDPKLGTPILHQKIRVFCVSIPGIDFAKGLYRSHFTRDGTVNDLARVRMIHIWSHSMDLFQAAKVEIPVLCAIGCGAFKGDVQGVVMAYALALLSVLSFSDYDMKAVCVSLPSPGHYEIFRHVFSHSNQCKVPVILTKEHGMLDLALHLSRADFRAGILNPSDADAVLRGSIGMYWLGHHIAFEELLAVQTTLLLQHKDFDPIPWKNRSVPVDQIPMSDIHIYTEADVNR